ncbi:MAG: porphobilinogen deaminase [bacterium]|nr:MAG: porphobilinogen deaminase [bacterium]
MRLLKIGTRKSPLALWQAEWVSAKLLDTGGVDRVELVKIVTSGDRITDVPLSKAGGKSLFTKEIEEALLSKKVDLAVHSLKDVAAKLPEGLKISVITERENPCDVLVSRGVPLEKLPGSARIGTCSLRRRAQLKRIGPDFEIVEIRGNIETRLRKLDSEKLDGVILAAAGLIRMGYGGAITQELPFSIMLPAAGQGALGIEVRKGDAAVEEVVQKLHHRASGICTDAERAFLKKLGGGCQVPIGAFAKLEGDTITIDGLVADLDGNRYYRHLLNGPASQAKELGIRLAERLISEGAEKVIAELC